MEGYYINGLKEYAWTEFYDNNQKKKYTNYESGIKQGSSSEWSKHGESFGNYINGKKDGLWHEYIDSKKKSKKIFYANGVRQLTRYSTFNLLISIVITLAIFIHFFSSFMS
jgi:antitoxin component YwqK of YwqJK toxin-antitoxin module